MSATLEASDLPIGPAAAVGLLSWLVGYVFTYVLVASDIRESGPSQQVVALG